MRNKNIFTIPNILSMFRLLLLPVIVYIYIIQKDYVLTGILLVVSGITDLLDGYIARRFNMMSDLGKILDPVADKATQAVVLLCLVTRFRWLVIPFICIVIKELFMTCIGMTVIKKTGEVHGALWHGKVATFMLDFMIIVHIIFYNISYTLSIILTMISTLLILLSFYLYTKENINILKKVG
ncbi:CDP-alcohol phosphatidyltransferase family protein [uncultured Catenibacterium sp.]|uniref:CDP-alcohol phosphatidyltransferase family protein n=1 Tax=uncultured Catenibacterium sp. TaxID=286142 RepID=UPI0025CFA6B3|nr:CDP-alcohol phosphatidyltransferase family protein [uncultured Catenibacterium sp.]